MLVNGVRSIWIELEIVEIDFIVGCVVRVGGFWGGWNGEGFVFSFFWLL